MQWSERYLGKCGFADELVTLLSNFKHHLCHNLLRASHVSGIVDLIVILLLTSIEHASKTHRLFSVCVYVFGLDFVASSCIQVNRK